MEWVALLVPAIASGLLGGAVATWLRTRPLMKKVEIEGEAALWARIEKLEAKLEAQGTQLDDERRASNERFDRQEERHASELREVKGELTLMRHDRNNLKMAVTFMVTRIKAVENDEMRQIAVEAEEMMTRGEQILATERGAMRGPA